MNNLNINLRHQRLFVVTVSMFLGYLFIFLQTMCCVFYIAYPIRHTTEMSLANAFVFIFNTLTYQNYLVGYMIMIYTIYFSLFLVRKFIEQLSLETNNANASQGLKDVAIIVDRICDSLDSLKVCYSINTVVYLTHVSFYTIITIYGLISYFSHSSRNATELIFSLITLCWECYYTPIAVWTFLMSSWIKKEGKMMEIFIQKLLHRDRQNIKAHKRGNLMYLQWHHRRPLISCGVFVIDWRLLFYFMGICFSYLVIVIQFDNQLN